MLMIVETDTDDLVGIRDRRIEADLSEREIGGGAFHLALGLRTLIGRNQRFEVGIFQAPRQIDHVIAVSHPIMRSVAGAKGQEFHRAVSLRTNRNLLLGAGTRYREGPEQTRLVSCGLGASNKD